MGQYYYWFKLNENEKFEKLLGCDGSKLLESTGFFDSGTLTVELLLKKGVQRVAFIGDYWDDFENQATGSEALKEKIKKYKKEFEGSHYAPKADIDKDFVLNKKKELSREKNNFESFFKEIGLSIDETMIFNHTKKEKIKIPHAFNSMEYDKDGMMMSHPLTILCAVGNGMGGGDFHDFNKANKPELAGHWAFDELEVSLDQNSHQDYEDKTEEYFFISY